MSNLFRQRKLPLVFGVIKEVAVYTAFYISLLNMPMLFITFYNTPTVQAIVAVCPWLTLPVTFAFIIVGLIAIAFIEYKWIMPTYFAFREKQYSTHGENPQMAELIKEVRELKEELKLRR